MKLKVLGLSRLDRFLFRFLFCWILLLSGVQIGLIKGRKITNEVWENALLEVSQEYESLILLERIIRLESGGKHEGVWGQDGERGILQFKQATFEFLKDKAGMPELKWERQADQIVLCNFAIRNGYAQKHWSTYKKAKGN